VVSNEYNINVLNLYNHITLCYFNFSMKKCHKTARTGLPEDEHLDLKHVQDSLVKLNH
jgi:hypothetical protein